jgi:hypothetical protein
MGMSVVGLLRLCVMNDQDVVADCAYMFLFHDNDWFGFLPVDPSLLGELVRVTGVKWPVDEVVINNKTKRFAKGTTHSAN